MEEEGSNYKSQEAAGGSDRGWEVNYNSQEAPGRVALGGDVMGAGAGR